MLFTRYAPFCRSPPVYCYTALPLDLHVLGLPLAFILSQDQTLHCICYSLKLDSGRPSLPARVISLYIRNRRSIFAFSWYLCLYKLVFQFFNELPIFFKRDCKDKGFSQNKKFFENIFSEKFRVVLPCELLHDLSDYSVSDECRFIADAVFLAILLDYGSFL